MKHQLAVNEERVNQFGSSLKDSIVKDLRDLVKMQGREARNQQPNYNGARRYQK